MTDVLTQPSIAYPVTTQHNIDIPVAQTVSEPNKSQTNGSIVADQNAGKPIYQVWSGKSKFWCYGRIMTGPDLRNLLTTFVLITIPVALYLPFPALDFITWGYDSEPGAAGSWAMIVCACLYVMTVVLLMRTALVDPGIIPPNIIDENTYHFRPRIQDVVVNGIHTQLKYCDTCNITRPPRSIHCSICNQCMDTFDHHCPWIGTCVAKHNYRSFYIFVHTLAALAIFVLSTCIYHQIYLTNIYLYRLGYNDGPSAYAAVLDRNPISLIIGCYVFIGMLFVLGLVGFHNYLVCTGQTTNEKLKHTYPHGSPNSTGCYNNFISLFCSVPLSHLDVQQPYDATKPANRNTVQNVDVKYIDHDTLQKLAERAYDTSSTSGGRNEYNHNSSQTRRDSSSNGHMHQQSIDMTNGGRHTRNASTMPIEMQPISEHGHTMPVIQPYSGTTPRNGSPAHKLSHTINAAGIAVEPLYEERVGSVRSHAGTPSLSIVVPDVVTRNELVDRSEIQSPLHERAPSISQVNLYTPINNGMTHSYDQHTTDEDNAIRERSIFQSPLLHSRNSSVSTLNHYANNDTSPNHKRNSSTYLHSTQGSPNRRTSVNGSAILTPRSAEYARRQSLTPTNEARATFMSPEASMPVNSSRRTSISTQLGQLPPIPDQPSDLTL